MKLKKLDSKPNLSKIQEDVIEFWKQDNTFEKSVEKNKDNEKVFYDGPPFPTGIPHHGTVLCSFIKDMISRYYTMQGYSIARRWGWDCHGMPIENQVEKNEGINNKSEIEKSFGIDNFNQKCYELVSKNNDAWREYVTKMGRWVDYDNSYKTMNNDYMESVMWTFKECYNKGLIYKDYRVTPYCYHCETSLSISDTRESDSTRPKQDRWVIAKFELDNLMFGKRAYMLAWTTTPWTLSSNMALAVNKKIDYALVEKDNEILIAGCSSLKNYEKVFGNKPNIVETKKGLELVGLTYKPLLPYFADKKKDGAFKIISADYVEEGEGLSVVHIAPAFGEDDYWVAKANNVPLVNPVDEKGCYTSEISDFASRNVMEANSDVIRFLYSKNLIVADGSIVHNYPHCWRCKTPLIYKAMNAWYLNIDKIKNKMIELNNEVNWVPSSVKDNRFGNWLNNARDWNLSRNRYWSTPIPVWECSCCGKREVLGSIAEIKEKSGILLTNLHRQFVDKVTYPCECGGTMKRIPEVLDCWFESGSAPHARLHYPFENKEWFDAHSPSDFVVEYTGQIRCWFYYLHVLSTALFDKPAFKNCVVTGTVLAKDGKKLSKSSKNYTDPMELMNNQGTDAFRLYMLQSKAMLLEDMQFEDEGVKDQIKNIIIPMWNAYNFFISYASIDGYEGNGEEPNSNNELDKWILALLYDTEENITKNMSEYKIDGYVPYIVKLIDGLTNWYIRRSRRRFYSSGMDEDKKNGYDTLYYVLSALNKMIAPLTPFIAEEIYHHMIDEKGSVHLCSFPVIPEKFKNEELLKSVEIVIDVIHMARVLRERCVIKNRQPLATAYVYSSNDDNLKLIKNNENIIKEELNVKNIQLVTDVDAIAQEIYKPNFAFIKANYAQNMGQINKAIAKGSFKIKENDIVVTLDDKELTLSKDALIIEYKAKENLPVIAENGILVSLDTTLTQSLIAEGDAREIVRNVQDARKQLGLELVERIYIKLVGDYPKEWLQFICSETLSKVADFEDFVFEGNVELSKGVVKFFLKRK